MRGSLENIPASGPVILITNHPYGILDGVMLGHILSQTRPDFRIKANSIFSRAPDLTRYLLPINLDEDRDALAVNFATRRRALNDLEGGGAIGIFSGGHSQHSGAALLATDGSGLAQFHRAEDRQIPRDGRADLL